MPNQTNEPNESLAFQVAFQGGGAKLVDLLAAADAIQELEKEGLMRVTRVAGTSAGAVVACLLATQRPIPDFVKSIKNDAKGLLRRMRIRKGQSRLTFRNVLRLIGGWPISNEEAIRTLFSNLLGDFKNAPLPVPAFVISADLRSGAKRVYASDAPAGPQNALVEALADSCGIPFFFRAHPALRHHCVVDGGICENLPTDELWPARDEFGPVVAVSFKSPDNQPPGNALALAFALLDTAISNSVTRARRLLGDANVFCINTKIGTFDFWEALELLDIQGEHYGFIKSKARDWFKDFLARTRRGTQDQVQSDPWAKPDTDVSDIMTKLGQVCDSRFRVHYRILRYGLVLTANSLSDFGKDEQAPPDSVREQRIFQPLEGVQLDCLTTGLSSSSGRLGPASWTVTDSEDADCPTVVIPIADPKGKMQRRVAIFLQPPIQPGQTSREPYTLVEQSSVRGAMMPLKKNGMDELSLENTTLDPFEHADLVLYVPENFPQLDYVPYSQVCEPVKSDRISRMSSQQIRQYGLIPPGFRAEAWTCDNLQPGQGLGFRFHTRAG